MFDDPFTLASNGSWMPAVEVSETNPQKLLTAELPGIEQKALKITIDNNVLTIAGEKEQELTDSPPAKNYYLSERFYGAFQRSFA
ncbi:MAG: Hsp20/alpha crystallin family protein, partial [Gemmatimonas sp.]